MIQFTKDIASQLPYDRKQYRAYFDEDDNTFDRNTSWHAVSLQQEEIRDEKLYQVSPEVVKNCVAKLEKGFNKMITQLDHGLPWIINHDDKDLAWFNKEDTTIPKMREFFTQNKIPISSTGCLIFATTDLHDFARELITYPYVLSYNNLDISHSKLQFIMKVTGHLTLDFLSTDQALLTGILNDDVFEGFLKIPYRRRM